MEKVYKLAIFIAFILLVGGIVGLTLHFASSPGDEKTSASTLKPTTEQGLETSSAFDSITKLAASTSDKFDSTTSKKIDLTSSSNELTSSTRELTTSDKIESSTASSNTQTTNDKVNFTNTYKIDSTTSSNLEFNSSTSGDNNDNLSTTSNNLFAFFAIKF